MGAWRVQGGGAKVDRAAPKIAGTTCVVFILSYVSLMYARK